MSVLGGSVCQGVGAVFYTKPGNLALLGPRCLCHYGSCTVLQGFVDEKVTVLPQIPHSNKKRTFGDLSVVKMNPMGDVYIWTDAICTGQVGFQRLQSHLRSPGVISPCQ